MPKNGTTNVPPPAMNDDPAVLDTQAREAIEKNADELRRSIVPIATEPATVYRP